MRERKKRFFSRRRINPIGDKGRKYYQVDINIEFEQSRKKKAY